MTVLPVAAMSFRTCMTLRAMLASRPEVLYPVNFCSSSSIAPTHGSSTTSTAGSLITPSVSTILVGRAFA